jgi:hypothetical protein
MKIGIPLTCPQDVENLMHKVFDELIVIAYGGKSNCGRTQWWCQCSCGNKKRIISNNLKRGLSTNCGCLQYAGHSLHDMSHTPEYQAWCDAKKRCYNESNSRYHCYGARGITMCEEWQDSFETFFEHVGVKPEGDYSLDRINNDKGYEPGNVRWATRTEQQSNQQRNTITCVTQ